MATEPFDLAHLVPRSRVDEGWTGEFQCSGSLSGRSATIRRSSGISADIETVFLGIAALLAKISSAHKETVAAQYNMGVPL